MRRKTVDYSNTFIYVICSKDKNIKDFYIGHASTSPQDRINNHKNAVENIANKDYGQYIYEFIRLHKGWDNFQMRLIEDYPCKSKRGAEKREQYWIEHYKPTLNSATPYKQGEQNMAE